MTLSLILYLTLAAFLISWLTPAKWKIQGFLIASIVSIFWLQPVLLIRNLDFWFPSAAILLTLITWIITQQTPVSSLKSFWATWTILALTIIMLAVLRYLGPFCCLTDSKPPPISSIAIYLLISFCLAWLASYSSKQKATRYALIWVIIGLLIIQKSPHLSEYASVILRKTTGQDVDLASALDISWLGFSYLAFRLLHVLQDANTGRLGKVSLSNFLVYAFFFPSYTAGPIDRLARFNQDLQSIHQPEQSTSILKNLSAWIGSENFSNGSQRIVKGIFKKFVLADSLAIIAMNDVSAMQVRDGFWVWVLVYAYSLRIYLDFSGYTDIAIGIGNWLGIKLPENFSQPYLKTNLTSFWNSWHITLSQWFRAYFFNPFTRWLRSHPSQLPVWSIILSGQFGVMLLIGLWHGISWNFFLWGLWHAIGLFMHNRWLDWRRSFQKFTPATKSMNQISSATGWFLTFNYVSLGWVWFALTNIDLSISILQKLFRW